MTARDRSVRWLAAGVLLSGTVSAGVLAVDGTGDVGGAFAQEQLTIYGPAHAALSVALVSAGVLLLLHRHRDIETAVLGIAGMCAAQLAGAGLVGDRRWPHYAGCCSPRLITEQDLVQTLAVLMAVICAVSAVGCMVVLCKWSAAWQGRRAAFAFPVALVVVVAVPRLMTGGWSGKDLVAGALTYSLPFAAALAVSALMGRSAALALAAAVVGSAMTASLGQPFLESRLPFRGALTLVVLAAAAVAVSRLVPGSHAGVLASDTSGDRAPSP